MALNIELFYIISRKLSLCGLFWTTLYITNKKFCYSEKRCRCGSHHVLWVGRRPTLESTTTKAECRFFVGASVESGCGKLQSTSYPSVAYSRVHGDCSRHGF